MTDLRYTDDEEQLRASVRRLLADRAPWQAVLARTETTEAYDPALWRALAVDLGAAGLPVPQDLGGHGASWRESGVIAEELGASVAGSAFLGSCVLATAAASAAGASDTVRELATGARIGALVVPVDTAAIDTAAIDTVPAAPAITARGDRLTGAVRGVIDASAAELLLVPARDGDQPVLVAVDASAVQREVVISLDLTRPLTDITFDDVPGQVLAEGDVAAQALRVALMTGAAMLACEQLGVAQRCLDMTVAYLKTRYQFGRPIGGYQALKHRLADLWAGITQARALARYAAGCLADGDPDAPIAASLAQAYCSGLAVRAAEECVQLHGGIGFTWEHPAHLYLKRAKADAITLGTAATHRSLLAGLVDLAPA